MTYLSENLSRLCFESARISKWITWTMSSLLRHDLETLHSWIGSSGSGQLDVADCWGGKKVGETLDGVLDKRQDDSTTRRVNDPFGSFNSQLKCSLKFHHHLRHCHCCMGKKAVGFFHSKANTGSEVSTSTASLTISCLARGKSQRLKLVVREWGIDWLGEVFATPFRHLWDKVGTPHRSSHGLALLRKVSLDADSFWVPWYWSREKRCLKLYRCAWFAANSRLFKGKKGTLSRQG